jgi:hypothetical protein
MVEPAGTWPAVALRRIVYIHEGEKKVIHSSSSSRAKNVMLDLLEKGIPAWIEDYPIQDDLDSIPF